MTGKFTKVFLKIAPFIVIGLFIWMETMFADSTFITHEDASFSVIRKGIVTAPADTIINSISEDGHFCFVSQSDPTVQMCSYPAPRPNNKHAEIFQGILPAGEWIVKDVGVYIDSNTPLLHSNNNLGGFIGLTVLMGLVFGCMSLVAFSQNRTRPESK